MAVTPTAASMTNPTLLDLVRRKDPNGSIAKVVEGEGPKKAGDRVRLLKTAP